MESLRDNLKKISWWVIKQIPFLNLIYYTRGYQTPVLISFLFWQKLLGFNRKAYWPMHFTSKVIDPKNVYAGIDSSPGYSPGCYIQAIGKIHVGNYTQIAPNVGIISANHDLNDNRKHIKKEVFIGDYCWIGMNSVVLPGVVLGDFTVVAAGSVVTNSFLEGYCVVGGVPAKVIKVLNRDQCIPFKNKYEYNGYVKSSKFATYQSKNLTV